MSGLRLPWSRVLRHVRQTHDPSVQGSVALLAGIRDGRLITRPSFLQMKNVRDARRADIPRSVIQHEDVLVFTRP
jgi:hypothetical protein